jgi:hypothetical protein
MNILLEALLGIAMSLGLTLGFALFVGFLGKLAAKSTNYKHIS